MAMVSPIGAGAYKWNYVTIAGQPSPGLAKVGKFTRKYAWDFKNGKGTKGTTATITGVPAIRSGVIVFQLWTAEHFAEWENFVPLFQYEPTRSKTLAGYDISHPSFDWIQLRAVICDEITNPVHKGMGLYELEVTLSEYLPPEKTAAVVTPSTATADDQPVTPETDPKQLELESVMSLSAQAWTAGND